MLEGTLIKNPLIGISAQAISYKKIEDIEAGLRKLYSEWSVSN